MKALYLKGNNLHYITKSLVFQDMLVLAMTSYNSHLPPSLLSVIHFCSGSSICLLFYKVLAVWRMVGFVYWSCSGSLRDYTFLSQNISVCKAGVSRDNLLAFSPYMSCEILAKMHFRRQIIINEASTIYVLLFKIEFQ